MAAKCQGLSELLGSEMKWAVGSQVVPRVQSVELAESHLKKQVMKSSEIESKAQYIDLRSGFLDSTVSRAVQFHGKVQEKVHGSVAKSLIWPAQP